MFACAVLPPLVLGSAAPLLLEVAVQWSLTPVAQTVAPSVLMIAVYDFEPLVAHFVVAPMLQTLPQQPFQQPPQSPPLLAPQLPPQSPLGLVMGMEYRPRGLEMLFRYFFFDWRPEIFISPSSTSNLSFEEIFILESTSANSEIEAKSISTLQC